jgi:hypothetical protein
MVDPSAWPGSGVGWAFNSRSGSGPRLWEGPFSTLIGKLSFAIFPFQEGNLPIKTQLLEDGEKRIGVELDSLDLFRLQ